jgi:hypothetical protein
MTRIPMGSVDPAPWRRSMGKENRGAHGSLRGPLDRSGRAITGRQRQVPDLWRRQ